MIFLTSWCYGVVGMLTRRMQKINFAVMLFYYSLVACPCTAIMILGETWVNDHAIRMFSYNGTQFLWMIGVSAVNFIGLNASTIAMQNERSGFVTLIGYIGLVYAFLGDMIIFKEQLAWLELLGISIVLCMNIALVCQKWSPAAAPNQPLTNEAKKEETLKADNKMIQ